MRIYIARHAWAGSYGDPGWPDDSLRELEPAGAERYARVVQTLADRDFAPELIATSPYVRCRQTAELIALHTPHSPQVVELDALTPGSHFAELCAWSQASEARSICWVGHAPDVGHLTAALIGHPQSSIRFAKGSIAAIRAHSRIGPDCGELHWLTTAKMLGL